MDADIKGVVRVYACGGAAINIAAQAYNTIKPASTIADFKFVMVDTSKANLKNKMNDFDCYLVDGLDGSGKIRKENSAIIAKHVRDIVQKHKPGDLNIILHSASGGSGSVLGPLIVKELLNKKVPVVVLCIGSTGSNIEALNTLNTLKSYESIATSTNAPVVMQYSQNSLKTPRAKVDIQMVANMVYLGTLFSKANTEMDSQDLYTWLRYSDNNATPFPPRLSALMLYVYPEGDTTLNEILPRLGNIISVATLAREGVDTDLSIRPEHHSVGILPPLDDSGIDVNVLNKKVINYIIEDGYLPSVHEELERIVNEAKANADARPQVKSLLSGSDEVDDTDLVL